jgi:hypothetical protein
VENILWPTKYCRRRARSDQYALYGAPKTLCRAPRCAVCLQFESDEKLLA